MKKFKIYLLISTIIWLIGFIWISISYLIHGKDYFPSIEEQIILLITVVNIGILIIISLIRQIKRV